VRVREEHLRDAKDGILCRWTFTGHRDVSDVSGSVGDRLRERRTLRWPPTKTERDDRSARTLGAMGTSAQKLRTAPTTAGAVRVPTARAAVAAAVAIISFACEGG
jgi:hypothetical protein